MRGALTRGRVQAVVRPRRVAQTTLDTLPPRRVRRPSSRMKLFQADMQSEAIRACPEPSHLLPLAPNVARLLVIPVPSLVPRAARLAPDKLIESLQSTFKTLAITNLDFDRHQ